MIDPDKFLNQKISSPSETNFIPVPVDDYLCMVPINGVMPPRETTNKDGSKSVILDINWEIAESDKSFKKVSAHTGMDKPFIKQSVFLDVEYDNEGNVIGLSEGIGKNIQLGRLREAVGLNKPGKDFSVKHLEGSTAVIKVEHRIVGEDTYAQVARKNGVTKPR